MMSTRKAIRDLSGVLRFGADHQVRAVQFLHDVQAAREAIAHCDHSRCIYCCGTGVQIVSPCEDCGGSGTRSVCRCFHGLDGEAVIEARRQISGGRNI
jgi:hypothetical protein